MPAHNAALDPQRQQSWAPLLSRTCLEVCYQDILHAHAASAVAVEVPFLHNLIIVFDVELWTKLGIKDMLPLCRLLVQRRLFQMPQSLSKARCSINKQPMSPEFNDVTSTLSSVRHVLPVHCSQWHLHHHTWVTVCCDLHRQSTQQMQQGNSSHPHRHVQHKTKQQSCTWIVSMLLPSKRM